MSHLTPVQIEYINFIKAWQAQTGKRELPPVKLNEKLSKYIQWCRSHSESPAAMAMELALAPFGIIFEKGVGSVGRIGAANFERPRGIFECLAAAQEFLDRGVFPSILSECIAERQLAGWAIRCQVGLLSPRHVPANPNSPGASRVRDFVAHLERLQTPKQFAAEWHAFVIRVIRQAQASSKGDGWCQLACQRSISSTVDHLAHFQGQVQALLSGRGDRPQLLDPLALFTYLNQRLGALARPVSFSVIRPEIQAAALRLRMAGVSLSSDLQEARHG